MAEDKIVSFVLRAVDQASATTQQVRESLSRLATVNDTVANSAAKVATVTSTATASLADLGKSTQIVSVALQPVADRLSQAAAQIRVASDLSKIAAQSFAQFGQQAAGAAPAIAGLAAGLGDLQRSSGAAESFRDLAAAAGTSVATLQELEAVALQNGVTIEELGNGFAVLAQKINEAQRPGSQASKDFQALGIQVQQLSESQRTVGGILPLVSAGLDKLTNSAGRAHAATALLGQDGAKIGPVLQQFTAQTDANKFSTFESTLKLVGLGLNDVATSGQKSISTLEGVRQVVSKNTLLFAGFAASIAAVPASLALLTHSAINLGDSLHNMAQAPVCRSSS
jgi:hypothetical protein